MSLGYKMITEEQMSEPREYTEADIQSLINSAQLEPAMGGREGPFWGQRVYYYTDYENDDVRTFCRVQPSQILAALS